VFPPQFLLALVRRIVFTPDVLLAPVRRVVFLPVNFLPWPRLISLHIPDQMVYRPDILAYFMQDRYRSVVTPVPGLLVLVLLAVSVRLTLVLLAVSILLVLSLLALLAVSGLLGLALLAVSGLLGLALLVVSGLLELALLPRKPRHLTMRGLFLGRCLAALHAFALLGVKDSNGSKKKRKYCTE